MEYRKQVDLQSLQSKKYFFVAGRLERPVGATNQDGFGVWARLNCGCGDIALARIESLGLNFAAEKGKEWRAIVDLKVNARVGISTCLPFDPLVIETVGDWNLVDLAQVEDAR